MDERDRVAEHLKTLSVLYYVYAGLHLLGVCVAGVWIALGGAIGAAIRQDASAPEGAEVVGGLLGAIGLFLGCMALAGAVLCFLSGRWIGARTNRTFSLVVAGITCLNMPLGTALGVFTFIVLQKPEAVAMYDEAAGAGR